MAFTTLDQLKGSKKRFEVNFNQATLYLSTIPCDLWTSARSYSWAGSSGSISDFAAISTPRQLNASVNGAIRTSVGTSTNPAYIDHINVGPIDSYNDNGCSFLLHDRLVDFRGISPSSTTPQSVGSVSLPRHASGEGVIPVLTKMVNNGTACTFTISYTNQAGISGRTSQAVTVANTAIIQMSYLIPLQLGDTGVRSIESIKFSSTSGTGEFGIFLMKPVCMVGSSQRKLTSSFNPHDFVSIGLPKVEPNAHLALLQMNYGGGNAYQFQIRFVQ